MLLVATVLDSASLELPLLAYQFILTPKEGSFASLYMNALPVQ